jgi:lipoprotein signal peptidase
MAGVALAVLLFDLATKELAVVLLAADAFPALPAALGFSFFLTSNEGAAGGVWLGEHTRFINILSMTLVVLLIALVARQVIATHRFASVAFGLIIGAAFGNTLSLLMSPGVTDFIALNAGSWSIAFNVADVALVAGVVILTPIAYSLAARVRPAVRSSIRTVDISRAVDIAVTARAADTLKRTGVFEREVPIAFASEVEKPLLGDSVPPRRSRTISDRPVREDETRL